MNYHLKTKIEVMKELGIELTRGLSTDNVEISRLEYGSNTYTREKAITLWQRIITAIKEPMLILLLMAELIAVSVNTIRWLKGGESDFLECIGIFIAIGLSVVITVVMEGRSTKAFEALSKINEDTKIKVIRDGKIQLIPQADVVVKDIVILETGDKIPADCRLIETLSFSVDESSLTGESMAVDKNADAVICNESTPIAERHNMIYAGCFVTGGHSKAIVVGVGDNTEFGKIARELSAVDNSSTPLQEKLAKLGKLITIIGSASAALVFMVQLVGFIINKSASFDTISEAFITSIVLIVAAVPEGLPTIVAVSLSINIIKMSKQQALVKKMVACETVGSINVICSDKTGTLTQNRMTVTDIYADGIITEPAYLTNSAMISNFCINSTADVDFENEINGFIGNPTECALLVVTNDCGVNYRDIRDNADIVFIVPFSSEKKSMTTVVKNGKDTYVVYAKGSPEKIISLCDIDKEVARDIEDRITEYQKLAYRIIGLAHKDIEGSIEGMCAEDMEKGMIYDGFVAIKDPLREDVYDAVKRCKQGGIELKMLTGDNLITAIAIANELKIIDDNHIAVLARELEDMSDEELCEVIPKISVIARSTPIIKMRVVKALKSLGAVVAVTGDGINDAPAIKNADVGISMGITGTEVSKEASDIVLLDDSFSTIARAVKWGRGIYENFQRFIQFQLTVNLSSVIVVLVSILVGFKSPFGALQLLWINIIMDGPPALVLGLEPIRDNLMDRSPTARGMGIVTSKMLINIIINGIFISVVFLSQTIWNFMGATAEEMSTVLFTVFVVFQLYNAFNCRELGDVGIFKKILENKLMLGVFALTFCLQVLITQFGGAFFDTVALPPKMWFKIIMVGFSVIIASEVVKLIRRAIKS